MKTKVFLVIIFTLAFILRLYQLFFFEFKNDQFDAIKLGNITGANWFLITHGTTSGVGVNNPPLFLWFMGLITFFTNNPSYITTVFLFFNLLALVLAIFYLYTNLPKVYAILSSIILAFSPAFTIYSSNIWAQCLLPLLMIFFHISFYRLIQKGKSYFFLLLAIIATLAAQLHLSAFFLFPLLIVIYFIFRDRVDTRTLLITIGVTFVMFLPYLYHLIFEGQFHLFFRLLALWYWASHWSTSYLRFAHHLII